MRLPAVVLLSVIPVALAQTAPVLRQRGDGEQGPQTRAAKGVSTLPDEASGEYELDERGPEHGLVVQITIEQSRLTGYVTKMEQGTALTLFFDHTTIDGNRVTFTTKTVHGLRYAFAGTIVRGDAETASEAGFYRLAGEWTAYHDGVRETEQVRLKSTPRN